MTVFNIPILEVCQNFYNNCIKIFKNEKFEFFVKLGVYLQFFTLKTAINFTEKPTGQQTRSLLTAFNIPIHEVCHKFDKNCMKSLEVWKVLGFLSNSLPIWDLFKT